MFAIDLHNYIQPLTTENINKLYFPDLYIEDNIKDLTKMKLSVIRKKINDFKLDDEYPTPGNSMFYNMQQKYKHFIDRLDAEYGIPFDIKIKYAGNLIKAEKIINERKNYIKEFNKIMIANSKFIIDNRDKILQQIDDVYNAIAAKVAEDLKAKRSKVSNEIIICECGAKSYRKNLTTHKKSSQHKLFIQSKQLKEPTETKEATETKENKIEEPTLMKEEIKENKIEKKNIVIKKPKKKVELIVEESSEEEEISDEEEEDEIKPVMFNMDYNGKKYQYRSLKDLYSGNIYRDWKLNGFSQVGKILDELDDHATKVLGLDIYVPPKIKLFMFV